MSEKILIKYKNGQQEALEFAPLSNEELYKFIDFLYAHDTPAIVALGTRRPMAWVNSLELSCFLDLAKRFIKANFRLAVEIAMQDPIAGLRVGPVLNQMNAVLESIPGANSVLMPPSAAQNGAASPDAPAPSVSPEATPAPSPATPLASSGNS
jgi:hypothetical protein